MPSNTAIASERAQHLFSEGFVVLDGFVEQWELQTLRGQVDDALAAPLPPGCERPHNTLVPLRWNDPIAQTLGREDRRRDELADASGAPDLRWISGYVSVKPPRSGPLWWHQDWWCWDHQISYRREAAQLAVLCLSDRDDDNQRGTTHTPANAPPQHRPACCPPDRSFHRCSRSRPTTTSRCATTPSS
jgi:hypothetical protein